jgi:LysR family transcriptional regulator, glycine cleavage system transcriptional activator
MTQRPLPPLNALKAFEAAARLGSFSQAAAELHVTHGAISRHVQLLEEWLGTPMFRRFNRRIALTEAGRSYLAEIGAAFDRIALATAQHLERGRGRLLRVNATTTLTLRWLIPRLSAFQRRNPAIEVRLTTSSEALASLAEPFDIAIRRSAEDVPGYRSPWVLPEHRIPVCSPALIARLPLRQPQDLRRHTLLISASRPEAWAQWLEASGLAGLAPRQSLVLEHNYQALQGALDGLGVAMGSSALIADDVASGRLVTPFAGPRVPAEGYRAYVAEARAGDPAIAAFCEWLQQIGAGEGAPA